MSFDQEIPRLGPDPNPGVAKNGPDLAEDDPGLDRQLAAALARRRPPEGFAERVLARAAVEGRRRRSRRRWAGALAAGLAALALALPPALQHVQQRRQAAAAEQARDQLQLALAITSDKLTTATRTLRDGAPTAPGTNPGEPR